MADNGNHVDSILQNVMANPALLSTVLSMAGKMSESLGLFSKGSSKEPPSDALPVIAGEEEEKKDGKEDKEVFSDDREPNRPRMTKHKKLVEALMLYVSEDRRPKLELVLKILDIVELAEGLRG